MQRQRSSSIREFCLAAIVVATFALANGVIQRIFGAVQNDACLLLYAIVVNQFTLLTMWVVSDSSRWSFRIFAVVLTAWLFEFVTVQFTDARPGLSLLFLAHSFILAPLLGALRLSRLFPRNHASELEIAGTFRQFTLRDAMLSILAISFLLLLNRWLVGMGVLQSFIISPVANIFMVFLFGTCTALVAIASLCVLV